MDALMAVLAFIVAGLYFVIAFSVVPRLAGAAQAAPGLLQVARWGASAFFAGCAVTHTVIGVASVLAAVHGTAGSTSSTQMTAMVGMPRIPAGSTAAGPMLVEHLIPHIAQIVGGLAFIGIVQRRLEWTVMSKDVAEGYRQRERQFRSAFERAPVGIALIGLGGDEFGEILQANPALRELAGLGPDRLHYYQDLLATSGPGGAARDLELLRAGDRIVNREHQLVRPDGQRLWLSVEASVVSDDGGSALFAVVQVRDITDRRRSELLRVAQHDVAQVVSEAVHVDAGLQDALRGLCEALGWAGGEFWEASTERGVIFRRTSWWAPPFADSAIARPGPLTYREGEGLAGAVWSRGEQIWVGDICAQARYPRAEDARASGVNAVIGLPIRSGDRAAVLLIFAAEMAEPDRELTTALEAICAHMGRFMERGRADEFRRLVESAPDAVVISNPEGRIVLVNARTEQLFGYRREQLLGRPVETLVPGDQPAATGTPAAATSSAETSSAETSSAETSSAETSSAGTGSPASAELDLFGRRRDGSRFPVEISMRPVDEGGERLVARSIRDLTTRRQAEELRFQLAAIVDSSHDAIIGSTLDGRITSWNRAAEEIFGYTEDEAVGSQVEMLLAAGHESEEEALLARVRGVERIEHHDAVRLRRDGRELPVSISMSPIRDRQDRLVGASRVIRDITQRKRAEAALSAAKESAEAANQALESFSYSVAHDLKAPLRSINGFSRILSDRYAPVLDEAGLRYLDLVCSSGLHMANLIDSLLQLSRVAYGNLRPADVDLSELATATVNRLRHEAPDRQVQVVIESGVTALGDPTLLANVMDNLLGNAWKFTRGVPDARIEFGCRDGVYFVSDDGAGFDMAHADKLFGVFQRLHRDEEFEGTGIGLATVQRIVSRHGGRIWAESQPGRGATFRFTLASGSAAPWAELAELGA